VDLKKFLSTISQDSFDGLIVLELKGKSVEEHDPQRMRDNLIESINYCRTCLSDE
jgi:hypothetical protein